MSGPDSSSNAKASMSVSLHPDFILDLASTSLIGSRAKLQDIPKVEQLIIGRIRNYVIENFVWPKVRTFNLPKVGGKKQPLASESKPPKVKVDSPPNGADGRTYDYLPVDGSRGIALDANDVLRSPSVGSTAGDEEDDDFDDDHLPEEEEEDSDLADDEHRPLRIPSQMPQAGKTHGHGSARGNLPASLKSEAHSSGVDISVPAGQTHRRLRRGSSLSSSTTASDLLSSSRRTSGSNAVPAMLTLSQPGLSASASSRSESGSGFSAQDIRQRIPLHSPGLGIGLKPGPTKRHSIQAYLPNTASTQTGQYSPFPPISSAYSNHLSRTSSVTSLPTLLSPRAEQPSASKLAALLDHQNPKWEAERRAADEARGREARSSGKKKLSPRKADNDVYTSPTTRSKSKPP